MPVENLHINLAKARKHLGITQEKISMDLGINQDQISRIEKGKATFIPQSYIDYLYSKGVSFEYLYGYSENLHIGVSEPQAPYGNQKPLKLLPIPIIDGNALEEINDNYNNATWWGSLPVCYDPDFTQGRYAKIIVQEGYMSPTVKYNDYVICKLDESPLDTVGKVEKRGIERVYYIITNRKGDKKSICSRLLNRITERDRFELKHDNTVYERDTLKKENILQCWEVKKVESANLRNQNADVYEKLNSIEEDVFLLKEAEKIHKGFPDPASVPIEEFKEYLEKYKNMLEEKEVEKR